HLNTFIQNRFLKTLDEILDLKLKSESESVNTKNTISEVLDLCNLKYQKEKLSLLEVIYENVFQVNLKDKFHKKLIKEVENINENTCLESFSDNFDDKYLKSRFEVKRSLSFISHSYLFIGLIFSLIFIMNGYKALLIDEKTFYQNGLYVLNYFSENMIGASKSILFCLLALVTSKTLKYLIGINKIDGLCKRIEDNLRLSQSKDFRRFSFEEHVPPVPKESSMSINPRDLD
ncbi:MAG: hypothetical protein CME61_06100, partial [Halobacteriovoraceae bacterium]|nr:hypothetical protein [Halobacteriovoraceae bacterium]